MGNTVSTEKKSGIVALGMAFVSVVLASATPVRAGELLRLKALGNVPIEDRSQELFQRANRRAGAVRHYVVQFAASVSESEKSALAAQGLEIERYLPDDAFVVRGTDLEAGAVAAALPSVRAVVPFAAEWKISPEFRLEPSDGASPEPLLVSTLADSSPQQVARQLARIPGVGVLRADGRDLAVSAPASRLEDIARVESVEWIQRAPLIAEFTLPADPARPEPRAAELTGYESGTRLMGFEAAWARGFHGEGQVAAVADTGLDTGDLATIHPDFKSTLARGYLMGLGTESWEDSMGHGTHVSGSVVGTGAASNGALKGGAHGGKLLFEGLWSAIFDNLVPGTDFDKLIGTVYRDGARVHSNSWGNARSLGDYDTLASRVDEFMWNNPEMLVLFAAGNSGADKNRDGRIDEGSVSSPGTAKNVLTVGASENLLAAGGIQKPHKELKGGAQDWGVEPLASDTLSNNPNGLAAFSSRGPTADGRLKPEIVAPGTNIVSTRSHHPKASKLWGEYDADYAYAGGTSMATPLTAGAALVVRQYLVEARHLANPSAALVKATLMHTATDLFPGQYGTDAGQELPTRRPNVHEGYGRVDMDAATALGEQALLVDEKAGVGLSEEKTFNVSVSAGGSLRATLAYTDAPASSSAAKTLVNDLDLVIRGPGGQVFQKQDRVNNSEMLELSGLEAGSYSVSVRGVNVPNGKSGKQPYALVVTPGPRR